MMNIPQTALRQRGGVTVLDGFAWEPVNGDGTYPIPGLLAVCTTVRQGTLVHLTGQATAPTDTGGRNVRLAWPETVPAPSDDQPITYARNSTNNGLTYDFKTADSQYQPSGGTIFIDTWYLSEQSIQERTA